MLLRWVELRDFRNHAHTKLKPIPEGLLVVVGANGEGKTNLLEGMHFLYALQSPRASASEPLVRHGASSGFVRGEFQTRDGKVLVEAEVKTKGANKVQVNRSPVRRRRDLRKQVRSVLFGPFDLPVITGDPSRRRAFMDEAVVALVPASDTLTSTYERVVRQRNRLLKEHDGRGAPPDLPTWDDQLVETGTAVIEARAAAVAALADAASAAFDDVAGYPLVVRYAPNVPADGPGDGSRRASGSAWRSGGPTSSSGGPPWSAPTVTTSSSRSATSAPGGSPATARRGWPRCRSDWPSPTRWRRRSGSRRS